MDSFPGSKSTLARLVTMNSNIVLLLHYLETPLMVKYWLYIEYICYEMLLL